MTDRELLELAAKAAGLDGHRYCEAWKEMAEYDPVEGCFHSDSWNPIQDDGDALRLAVKLRMSVEISEYEQSTYAYAGKVPRVYACEMWRDDKDASTRRAITRAAAEIGKAMP